MRLLKQTFLYFKEGNSDKVYEIDLCEVVDQKYVVNFRYGKRNTTLKEGCKTPVPVSLAEAEKIFDTVETEKINKGYTTSPTGVSEISKPITFTLVTDNIAIDTNWYNLPKSAEKAILQRLHHIANGTKNNTTFQWRPSRIIWKAGQYKINEAAPYIIKLFNNGNQIHQYSCTWALARCGKSEAALTALGYIYKSHPITSISKIAGIGLLQQLGTLEKAAQLLHYINRLPELFKKNIEAEDRSALHLLLQERIVQQQPNYNWLEDVYIIATEKKWMRSSVKEILLKIPLQPNYFKHIRAVFKLAELIDDYEITGLLSCRFERETEMFTHSFSKNHNDTQKIYVPKIEEWVVLSNEFRKNNTRLAYSQKTRWYFHNRILRQLQTLGKKENIDYVKLSTAILISYKHQQDFKPLYATSQYKWNGNNYTQIETRFLQNAQAIFLHQILSGHHTNIKLNTNHMWHMRNENQKSNNGPQKNNATNNTYNKPRSIIRKIAGLFSRKKQASAVSEVVENTANTASENINGTPYLHLWNQMPQAYIQLLMDAEMEEVHEFAESNLTSHAQYNTIKEKINKQACKQLLLSAFPIPAKFGFTIAIEKYSTAIPDDDILLAMLNSNNANARNQGQVWTEKYKEKYFEGSDFITQLIFARNAEIRIWATKLLINNNLSTENKKTIVGKAVAEMMGFKQQTIENETIIKDASNTLFEIFAEELKGINLSIVSDLIQHDNASVLLFGIRVLKIKKPQLNFNQLSNSFVFGLLQHAYSPVREEGISILCEMSEEALLQKQSEIIDSCLSAYANVRQGLQPIVKRMAQKENTFGVHASETLMPYLLRKETVEGIHGDTSKLLCNELSDYLQNANKQTALNLLYANYSAAQNVGIVILEKYTDAAQLTMPQVIALGAHENVNVRAWCWKFYTTQTPRIKYEKETSIKLLESKWQDTRQFAMQFFRENFTASDWSPEILITLSDSVKPEIEAFGRELITKFFESKNGEHYLLKLSQHPSEKMQLFATNYLQQFAADNDEKLQSLSFYFKSVLTRVNKSRIAKNRIYTFLLQEGRKTESAAIMVSAILSDVSATAAIGDKAKCIDILLQLNALYNVTTPVKVKEIKLRTA